MATTENDDLTCPITLELLRDPVLASDGHVYEREAITRWILQHSTSPLTGESLNINDLQADDHLRRLAARRRNSTVSFNARNDTETLPPAGGVPGNTASVAPIPAGNVVRKIHRSKRWCLATVCGCLISVMVFTAVLTGGLIFRKNSSKSTSNDPPILGIAYSSALTMNSSVFTRPGSSSNQFYYKAIQVQISVTGFYTFQSVGYVDMYGYLYGGYFNAANPNMNLLLQDDDSGWNLQFLLGITLVPNNYTLVATTYNVSTTGSFSIAVNGPASVSFS